MQKLSAKEMKALIGGGDMGTGGRSACTARIEYRHSNSTAFARVATCDNLATDTADSGTVVSCSCS
jgi:hypothetical protein